MQSKKRQSNIEADTPLHVTLAPAETSLSTERLIAELRTRAARATRAEGESDAQSPTPDVVAALSCATEEELWDELCERYTSCVLAYSKPGKGKFQGVSNVNWFGTIPEVMGLSKYLQLDLKQRLTDFGLDG